MSERREEPFFCYLLPNAPHGPYLVDKKYSQPFVEKGFSQNRANFYGMLVNIDENMGRLELFLQEQGLRDNTIVVFMTDNGTAGPWYPKEGRDHTAGLRGIKGSIYEGGHRVPFFVRWPDGDIGGGRDVGHLAAHIDVLPTLMELSGAPRASKLSLHGQSLVPLLVSPDAKWKPRTLVVNNQRIAVPQKYKDFVVMSGNWRLVGKEELYNLSVDRGQQKNVANSHPEITQQLLSSYDEWWNMTSGRASELVPITIGSEQENPAFLTAHDWHAKGIPWHQEVVAEAPELNGHWEIHVAESGNYRITLMERPPEAQHRIAAKKAVLEVGDSTFEQEIPAGSQQIHFDLKLNAGRTQLKSTLTTAQAGERGAYYASVLRLETR